jgi:hypothetical protein
MVGVWAQAAYYLLDNLLALNRLLAQLKSRDD